MKRFRKLVALLLAAVMVTGVFPAGAAASQVEPMSFTTTHINPLYRDSITEADLPDPVFSSPSQLSGVSGTAGDIDEAAASLRDQMEERMEEAVVSIFLEDVTQEIFEATATEILDEAFAHTGEPTEGDYLQWHYGGCNISGEVDGADGGYILNLIYAMKYHSTAAQEAELDKAVDALLAALDLEDENDYRKVKGVYDYICANITYDYDSSGYLKHTAYAALVNKTAVCQGYASLLYRLLLELGVDTRVIAGTGGGGNHGWNIVELKDLYYNADSTWDAGSSHYNYFLRSMNNFPDHSRWEEYATADFNAEYPMDSKNYTPTTCEANGHAYSQTVTAPTCKEQGYTTYTCTGCGDSYRDDYTETVPHSWDEGIVTTQPTETEAGVKTYTCGTCGDTRTEEIPKLEHTHVYTSVVTEPTCKTQGYTTHTCACGHSYRDTYTETIPHSWDEGVVTTQPTETETGVKTYTCGACGETKTEEIPKLDHTHVYTSVVTEPTCKEQGYTTYTCACGDSYRSDYTETVPHSWDEGVVTTQPTETETGVKTYTCGVCGDTRTEEIPELGHTHQYTAEVTAPTCKEQGYTTYTCACGDSYRSDYTETVPHSWDEGVVTTQPTDTEPGVKTYTCTVCGETKTEEIPMLEPATDSVKRVAGTSRADTALEVADALKEALGVEKFDTIIIANGEDKNFPDALTGSYLATVKEAPILMYRTSGLSENTRAYIRTNLIAGGTVYLLGGELAIPATVAEELTAAGYTVERLAGGSRFDTNLAILEEAGVGGSEILIARGFEFADSLSASATGLPILMVNEVTGKLTEAQVEFLQKYEDNVMTILGGTVAVSEALEATIEEVIGKDVDRVAGGSREATSVEIAKRYFDVPDFAVIAYSRKCPDGLCGGPLAYAMGAPLLLVNAGQERYANAYTAENEITAGYVLGGTLVVTDATARAAFGLAEDAVIEMK